MKETTEVAFKATLVGNWPTPKSYTGIWLDDGYQRHPLALTGYTAPLAEGSGVFASLSDPVCNSARKVAFLGTLKLGDGVTAANATGIWTATSGTLKLVARAQAQAPDCPQGVVFSKLNQLALPDQGGVVVLANLAGKGVSEANNQGIWAVNTAGQLRLIAREGDMQIVNGATKTIAALSIFASTPDTPGQSRSFNSPGDLTYKATFTDKTEAIYRVVFP